MPLNSLVREIYKNRALNVCFPKIIAILPRLQVVHLWRCRWVSYGVLAQT